ncbi:MAG TPA: HlyD family efflux transporter periplasmic adaptor subunit [Polyangiaceae bacterium]|nr:HlyD family efflux transporter periplasmic adaptor subunit [Polyangiaceae bacterium]
MIKNFAAAAVFAVFSSALSTGCSHEDPAIPGYQGIVELDEWVLGFELGGRVSAVPAIRGETVASGAKLASLDSLLESTLWSARKSERDAAESQLALLKAGSRGEEIRSMDAQVRAAKATEDLLVKSLAREKELRARNASTDAAVEDLQGRLDRAIAERQSLEQKLALLRRGSRSEELRAAEARLDAASSQVKLEEERIQKHDLVAPSGGVILDVHVKAGEVVGAGSPVVTLGDTKHPYADVFVPEGKLKGLHAGTKATVRVDGVAESLPGSIETLGRTTEFTPRFLFSERERPNLVIRVRVRIDDPRELLHAGVPAFVEFEGRGT